MTIGPAKPIAAAVMAKAAPIQTSTRAIFNRKTLIKLDFYNIEEARYSLGICTLHFFLILT